MCRLLQQKKRGVKLGLGKMPNSHIIEVEHLVKSYADPVAVNDISFGVEQGRSLVFLVPMEREGRP